MTSVSCMGKEESGVSSIKDLGGFQARVSIHCGTRGPKDWEKGWKEGIRPYLGFSVMTAGSCVVGV